MIGVCVSRPYIWSLCYYTKLFYRCPGNKVSSLFIMYPAPPSITSQQNTPICHCRQQDAIPCTGTPRESMVTTVTIIKRNISFPTTEKPLMSCSPMHSYPEPLFISSGPPQNFSYKDHAIQSDVSPSHTIQNSRP